MFNIKALGLALVAALAMSAVVASSASAASEAKFTTASNQYPAVFKGEQKGEENFFSITGGAQEVRCETATYQGTLAGESSEITVTPHYGGATSGDCRAFPNDIAVAVHLNSCDFVFTAGTKVSDNESQGEAGVSCVDPGDAITLTIATCTVHVEEQHGLKGVTFTNLENGNVTVDVNVQEEIAYIETDGFLCPFEGNNTQEDGSFVSTVEIDGFVDSEEPTAHPHTEGETTYGTGKALDIDVR